MGINHLWDEIKKFTPGEAVDLARLSADCVKDKGRPLRLAIDAPVILFRYKTGAQPAKDAGGMNHPSRTLFYHVTHLMLAGVQPIFIYDGLAKPVLKRGHYVGNARTFYPAAAASSARTKEDVENEFEIGHMIKLSRDILDYMGVPWYEARGEAEAECAALERAGIVDAILTSDGDSLAFGAVNVLKLLDSEQKAGRKVCSALSFNAQAIAAGEKGLTRDEFVLVALLAGSDYDPGVYGCGQKLSFELARAGYGKQLCEIVNSGNLVTQKISDWRMQLVDELRTNHSGRLTGIYRDVAERIPTKFPDDRILYHYLRPAVSSGAKLEELRTTIQWSNPIDAKRLHAYAKEWFDWKGRDYSRKFIKVLAPALLARRLLVHAEDGQDGSGLFTAIVKGRQSENGSGSPDEVRLEYVPQDVVGIDWQAEPLLNGWVYNPQGTFKPDKPERDWFPEFLAERGSPAKYKSWGDTPAAKTVSTKRNNSSIDGEDQLAEPTVAKRPRGRPRKSETAVVTAPNTHPEEPQLKRKRGRPRKDATDTVRIPGTEPSSAPMHHGPAQGTGSSKLDNPHEETMQTPRKPGFKTLPPLEDFLFPKPSASRNSEQATRQSTLFSDDDYGDGAAVAEAIRRSLADAGRNETGRYPRVSPPAALPPPRTYRAPAAHIEDDDGLIMTGFRPVRSGGTAVPTPLALDTANQPRSHSTAVSNGSSTRSGAQQGPAQTLQGPVPSGKALTGSPRRDRGKGKKTKSLDNSALIREIMGLDSAP